MYKRNNDTSKNNNEPADVTSTGSLEKAFFFVRADNNGNYIVNDHLHRRLHECKLVNSQQPLFEEIITSHHPKYAYTHAHIQTNTHASFTDQRLTASSNNDSGICGRSIRRNWSSSIGYKGLHAECFGANSVYVITATTAKYLVYKRKREKKKNKNFFLGLSPSNHLCRAANTITL